MSNIIHPVPTNNEGNNNVSTDQDNYNIENIKTNSKTNFIDIITGKRKKRETIAITRETIDALTLRRQFYPNLESDTTQNLDFGLRNIYSAPSFATLPVVTLLAVYLTTFYESIGAQLAYLSFFIALARSLDVLSDPVMSYITDSYRSKHGRRRPFCFIGCFIYSLFLNLLLSPPSGLQSVGVSIWFGFTYIGFFLSNTIMTIPYDALGPELTDNSDDRDALFFTTGMYDGFGALLAIILPGFFSYMFNLSNESCDYRSCFNTNGVGQSCLTSPATGEIREFILFEDINNCISSDQSSSDIYNDQSCYTLSVNSTANPCLDEYCSCIQECTTLCTVSSNRFAYSSVAIFFGVWCIFTMLLMVYKIKERSQLQLNLKMAATPPLVSSLLNTLRNKAFVALLPAWVLDSCSFTMIASMMTYFVRYVLQPEYQTLEENGINCNEGIPVVGQDSDSWRCNSNIILGGVVSTMLIAAFCGCPVWLFWCKYYGKQNTWMFWSFSMSITIALYGLCTKGSVTLSIVLGAVGGFPLGAKFLNDAILADIIDYDEFLTGQRSEATYTMFKSFLPKICAIPAAAIPIAILNAIGHVPPVDGRNMPQPKIVSSFCMFAAVICPALLSFASLYYKNRYPLKHSFQLDMVAKGVGRHMLHKNAYDPICGMVYRQQTYNDKEKNLSYYLDAFPTIDDANLLKVNMAAGTPLIAINKFVSKSRDLLIVCIFLVIASAVAATISMKNIDDEFLSIIPVFIYIY
jgi:Na+/melibiose symporter-like transporter